MSRKLFTVTILLALILAAPAAARPVQMMPGVTYDRILQWTPSGPMVLYVITAPKPGGLYSLTPLLSNGTIALANGAAFEEGAFGKGYALDRMLAAIHGDAIINFGGQIAVRGAHEVAIAHPLHRERPLVTLTLHDASLSTSSGSEKTFVAGGRRFSHLIDPRTGEALPPRGSVSVIDRSAFRADALSTALYVMGPERGLAWARAHDVVAIFITESGEITWSRKP